MSLKTSEERTETKPTAAITPVKINFDPMPPKPGIC